MATVVIGDIHGGYRALRQVLEISNLPKGTQYIFVGDYVDGWSQSAEVVTYLIEFSEKQNCIFIRGNHDELLYKYLKFNDDNPTWRRKGGESSIKSYAKLSPVEKKKHIHFFENLVNYHIDSENRLYLHAGFTSQQGPQHEYYANLVYWDRTLWEMVCAMDASISEESDTYPKRLKLFKEIYIGHTPVNRIGFEKPVKFANVWNVDTGAAFQGRISMIDVDSKNLWQSDPVFKLYPQEKGRN